VLHGVFLVFNESPIIGRAVVGGGGEIYIYIYKQIDRGTTAEGGDSLRATRNRGEIH
jgi:hypothetical protein